MSKNKNMKSHLEKLPEKTGRKRRMLMLTAVLFVLMMTGGVLAQWAGVFSSTKKSTSNVGDISPASLTTTPKEFVYAGGNLISTEEPPGGCIITLSSGGQSVAESTPSGNPNTSSFSFTASCNWTVTKNASFINITSPLSGSGNSVVNFTVDNNPLTTPRSGMISVNGGISPQTFTIYQGMPLADVPRTHPFYTEIGRLAAKGLAIGCTPANSYCPEQNVTRQEMAYLIIGAFNPPGYVPPAPASQRFNDVAPSNPYYAQIEQMALLQITLGCSASPPLYCPADLVTREQMAAFFIRSLHAPGYLPPAPATQRFNDVPPENIFYAHIEEMAVRNITLGCSAAPPLYCPALNVTRGQMAAFLVRAFNL
jgi:hypothetical protein